VYPYECLLLVSCARRTDLADIEWPPNFVGVPGGSNLIALLIALRIA
jgi:hypothetical protein